MPDTIDVPAVIQAIPVEALQEQRWFGAKGRGIRARSVRDFTILPGSGRHFLTLLDLAYTDGESETYFLPLALDERPGNGLGEWSAGGQRWIIRDGLTDGSLCRAMLAAVAADGCLGGERGAFAFRRTQAFNAIVGPTVDLPTFLLPAEQSNTLVRFGERALLKAFRRVVPGTNPDLEVSHFLTTKTTFRNVPRLAATVEYVDQGNTHWPLAALLTFIPNQGNAWERVLSEVSAYYRGEAKPNLNSARRLGERTGELHAALASGAADPAFAPEPVTADDLCAWAQALGQDVMATMLLLGMARSRLPPEAWSDGGAVLNAESKLNARVARLRALAETSRSLTYKVRVHGDYHLAQVLVTGDDFAIIDFEGEPARPPEERRAKQHVLKDVAGMLRSFNYAGFAALFELNLSTSLFEARRVEWEQSMRSAFLTAYRRAVGEAQVPLLPESAEEFQLLLDLFELEKALYELRYELLNRPDWVRIPLSGIRAVLASPRSPEARA